MILSVSNSPPKVYSTHHISREGKIGGGVGIVIRNTFKTTPLEFQKFKSFEYIAIRLNCKNERITLVDIYRPPGHISNERVYVAFGTYYLAKG